MPTYVDWSVWKLDLFTWLWLAWIVQFAVIEAVTLRWFPGHELTAHLRPVFLAFPVTYWMFFGLYIWLGLHFFAPAWETALLDMVRARS